MQIIALNRRRILVHSFTRLCQSAADCNHGTVTPKCRLKSRSGAETRAPCVTADASSVSGSKQTDFSTALEGEQKCRFKFYGFSRFRKRCWRRGPGSNRRIKVLQTSPLPLGYRALAGLPIGGLAPVRRSQPGWRRRAEWSGRRDLNSRPSPWQGDALPLSYSRLLQY